MGEQQHDSGSYRAVKLADFVDIPDRVWPTPVYVLEQGGDLLIYRNADATKRITSKQAEIFRLLVRMGQHPDAPGSISVIVCTGASGVTYDRQVAIFDHMNTEGGFRLAQSGEVEQYIGDWFKEREGRR